MCDKSDALHTSAHMNLLFVFASMCMCACVWIIYEISDAIITLEAVYFIN